MGDDLALAAFESLSVSHGDKRSDAVHRIDDNDASTKAVEHDGFIKLCIYLKGGEIGVEVKEINPNFAAWIKGTNGFCSKNETRSGYKTKIFYGGLSALFPIVNGKDASGKPVLEYLLLENGRTFGYFMDEEDARKGALGLSSTIEDAVNTYRALMDSVYESLEMCRRLVEGGPPGNFSNAIVSMTRKDGA